MVLPGVVPRGGPPGMVPLGLVSAGEKETEKTRLDPELPPDRLCICHSAQYPKHLASQGSIHTYSSELLFVLSALHGTIEGMADVAEPVTKQ